MSKNGKVVVMALGMLRHLNQTLGFMGYAERTETPQSTKTKLTC